MNHLAFDMEEDELEAALERLQEAGVEHTHMVFNHDDSPSGYARQMHEGVFVRSVYFTDPNGIMLEFAATTRAFGPEDVCHAPATLAEDA
jgi:catechol 2,3-dioxygenase-like lactoylglutathione lyase family enzyme